ncbi:MAG: glycosyltransferase family 4 protein [Solirubrobacteraceae bacterium]
MRRLRVLYLIDNISQSGGAERAAAALAMSLPHDRFEVWMCSTRWADPTAVAALTESGVRHVHIGRRSKWDVHRLAALVSLVRRQRFDVLHAHLFGSNLWGTLIGRLCGVPVLIAHEHTWSYEGNPLRKWLDGRVIGRLATRFVAVSSLDAERMVTIEHVPPEKVVMIPNAHVPRPGPVDGDLRQDLHIDNDTPLISVVSVLRPQKALSVLLDAYSRVLESLPNAHLIIAGDGPCRGELEQQTRELGLTDKVHFLGRRTDVDAILSAADVAAMSSDYEGTPLVTYECMANRTPLVATAVGGLPDVIQDGRTGLLVPPRDPSALATALICLLTDPVKRERIAAAAAECLPEFTIEAATQRFATLYETLAAESGLVSGVTRSAQRA